jgi:hypothetical protein
MDFAAFAWKVAGQFHKIVISRPAVCELPLTPKPVAYPAPPPDDY